MSLLLCLVIFTGAVACSGEKGALGQKVAAPEVQQGKTVVTHGKHREKTLSSQQCAPE
ncbi:adhesin, partial [Salmonella enterica]|nr:adhesin [Salmonella enterica]